MSENYNGNQPKTPPSAEFSLLGRAERIERLETELIDAGRGYVVALLKGCVVESSRARNANNQNVSDNLVGAEGLEPPTLSV